MLSAGGGWSNAGNGGGIYRGCNLPVTRPDASAPAKQHSWFVSSGGRRSHQPAAYDWFCRSDLGMEYLYCSAMIFVL